MPDFEKVIGTITITKNIMHVDNPFAGNMYSSDLTYNVKFADTFWDDFDILEWYAASSVVGSTVICEYDKISKKLKVPYGAYIKSGVMYITLRGVKDKVKYSSNLLVLNVGENINIEHNEVIDDPHWLDKVQEIIDSVFAQKYDPQYEALVKEVETQISENKKLLDKTEEQQIQIDSAIGIMGDYEIVSDDPTQIRFKKGNGEFGDTVDLGDGLASKSMVNAGYYQSVGSQYSGSTSDYGIEIARIEGAYKTNGTPTPENPIEPKFFHATSFNINGGNLFDASKIPTKTLGSATITNNQDGSFTIIGSGTLTADHYNVYIFTNEETLRLLKVGKIKLKQNGSTYPRAIVNLTKGDGTGNWFSLTDIITEVNVTEKMLQDSGCKMLIGVFGAKNQAIKQGTIKPMLYQDGYEVFYPFNASSTPVDIELRALPNGVKDTYENGLITRRVGVATFDGSDDESWEQFSVQYSIAISNMKIITGNPTNKTVISNRFDTTIQTSLPLGTIRQAGNTNKVHINYDNGTGGIQQFKDFLKSHPIKVWYELATPTTKQYTIPTLTSYYPFTNAWCDSELETSITWNALTGKSSILDGQGNVISKGYMSPQDNFLANSDFASGIINQKGQTTYTANDIYTIDMWRLVGSGSFGGKVTVGTNDILIENNGTEDAFFVNKTDLSYLIDRDYLIYVNAIGLGNNNAYVYCDAESGKVGRTQLTQGENFIKINGKPTTLGFELASTTRLRINKVKLEKGSRFTGMKPWNKGIEFAKCINKYRFELNNYYPIYEITGNKAIIPINHNGMDKKPSVIVDGGFCKGADGLTATFTSYTVVENKDNSTTVEVTFNKNIQGTSACLNVIIDSYDY